MHLSICGFDCEKCPIYVATINNDLESLKRILKVGPSKIVTIEKDGCLGCLSNNKNAMCKACFIQNCSKQKAIDSCGKCNEYPCNYVKNYLSVDSLKNLNKINNEFLKNPKK